MRASFLLVLWLTLFGGAVNASAQEFSQELSQEQLWQSLSEPNTFAMLRHSLAPGIGDPANFDLEKRDTQRNLSTEGRNQSVRIGDLFRANGIEEADIYSSAWFRCLETAELMDLGEVRPLSYLNSFFAGRGDREQSTTGLKEWLYQQNTDKTIVLVTHQVNITALTGVFPSSGEIVFVHKEDNGLRVLGSIRTL